MSNHRHCKECEDCGTILEAGVCPNCQEELFIFDNQMERDWEDVSPEFIEQVNKQRKEIES